MNIEAKNESIILLGDLNRHISNNLIKENHKKSTLAGRLLVEFVSGGDYVLVNSLDCVEGGPFTRFDRNDPLNFDKKSTLDLVVVSSNLGKFIDKLQIDKNQEWTASRSVKGELKYPDHYALLLTFKGIPMKAPTVFPGRKTIRWNTRKRMGWENYKMKTEYNEALLRAAVMEEDSEEVLKSINKELTKIKFACFGKVKIYSKNKKQKQLEKLQMKRNHLNNNTDEDHEYKVESIDKEMAETLKEIEKEKLEKDLRHLETLTGSKG